MTSSAKRFSATNPSTATGSHAAVPRRALLGASIGNMTEWFDYSTYGYLAATLGAVFFPFESPTLQLLSSFAAFGVAFFVRPLGGFFFGSLGDKIGRQRTLAMVIILMAAATFAAGLLPSYGQAGLLAPALLVAARLLQGFSAGGELGGASTFLAEHAPVRRRGFVVSWLQSSTLAGLLLGSLTVLALTSTLSEQAMTTWGWRIPFLLAGPLGVIGLYIRLKLDDTPAFKALVDTDRVARSPLRTALKENRRELLQVAGLVIAHNSSNYLVLTYLLTYLSETVGIGQTAAAVSTGLTLVVGIVTIPLFGALSDRVGRKPVLGAACLGFVTLGIPLFLLMNHGGLAGAIVAHVLLGMFVAAYIGVAVSLYAELFPTPVRYGGFSVAYNVSTAVFGGGAPFLAVALISVTGSNLAPSVYLVAGAVVSFLVLLTVRETARQPLRTGA